MENLNQSMVQLGKSYNMLSFQPSKLAEPIRLTLPPGVCFAIDPLDYVTRIGNSSRACRQHE